MEVFKNIIFNIKNRLNELIKDKYFILLSVFFFIFLFLYWEKFGDPVIDCGREAYIPYAMANFGKVLFKDIICIYGPVPYYINAVLVKFLGANLSTMYLIGAILSYIFIFALFNLAKRFFDKRLAFLFALFILSCCVFNTVISNYIFPYAYATVYAVLFAVFHLIFLFNFLDDIKISKEFSVPSFKNLYISSALLSLCLLSKLDFLPCIFPFVLILFKYHKNFNLKTFFYVALSFFAPFFAVAFVLFIQKVSFQNLMFNFKMISNMAHSPSLEYFYSHCTGYFFEFKKTFMFVKEFLISALIITIAGFLSILTSKIKNKKYKTSLKILIAIVFALILWNYTLRYIFTYIPLLLLFILLVSVGAFVFKKLKLDEEIMPLLYLLIFSILFSLKSLFGLFHELYGVYYLPFILLSFISCFLFTFRKHKSIITAFFKSAFLLLSFAFIINNLIFLTYKDTPVKSSMGNIYTANSAAYTINHALNYLNEKLNDDDTVLVLPEGLLINYLLKKPSSFFNTSFTPLDFDAYGEDYLTDRFLSDMPKYVLILSRDFHDYGKSLICVDFGRKFCSVIRDYYTFDSQFVGSGKKVYGGGQKDIHVIQIFERKK